MDTEGCINGGRTLRPWIIAVTAALCPLVFAGTGPAMAGAWMTDAVSGGTWHAAQEVPGLAALNKGNGWLLSMSCASAGNCSARGTYGNSSGQQVFVVSEVSGTWHNAKEVPGTATLNAGGAAGIESVSSPPTSPPARYNKALTRSTNPDPPPDSRGKRAASPHSGQEPLTADREVLVLGTKRLR
jgi:hypothetical protein